MTTFERLTMELNILKADQADRRAAHVLENFDIQDRREEPTRRALEAARRLGFDRRLSTQRPEEQS